MIGVAVREEERYAVAEFFELFKTPWEWLRPGKGYDVILLTRDAPVDRMAPLELVYSARRLERDACETTDRICIRNPRVRIGSVTIPVLGPLLGLGVGGGRKAVAVIEGAGITVGFKEQHAGVTSIRIGYDLFSEVAALLSRGQGPRHAEVPTLDRHIACMRGWIADTGRLLLEIPAKTADSDFFCCLTHDIDFGGIRFHRASRSLGRFLFQSTIGSLLRVIRHEASVFDLARNWLRVISLPLVFLGVAEDFWMRFDRYADLDGKDHSTFYLLPFKGRGGAGVPAAEYARRAARYDVCDVQSIVASLAMSGCEIGLHGIDAWHDPEMARKEASRVMNAAHLDGSIGVRIHWLLQDELTPRVLDGAGFDYDSSVGFNETVGYRAGTALVFRAAGCQTVLELPLHIQDVALFSTQKGDPSFARAHVRCRKILDHVQEEGGVVTVLWHDRSLHSERNWDRFYVALLEEIRSRKACFRTARSVVQWFRARRSIRFEEVRSESTAVSVHLRFGAEGVPQGAVLRVHLLGKRKDFPMDRHDTFLVPLRDGALAL